MDSCKVVEAREERTVVMRRAPDTAEAIVEHTKIALMMPFMRQVMGQPLQ